MDNHLSPRPASAIYAANQQADAINAWLVEYSPQKYIALSQTSCHEILETVETVSLPGIPSYSTGLLQWRGLWLPLIDFESLITGDKANTAKNHLTLIVSYLNETNQSEYTAIALPAYPQLMKVSNDMLCALPEKDGFDWSRFALSCFRYRNNRVPILDTQKFFSQPHS